MSAAAGWSEALLTWLVLLLALALGYALGWVARGRNRRVRRLDAPDPRTQRGPDFLRIVGRQ